MGTPEGGALDLFADLPTEAPEGASADGSSGSREDGVGSMVEAGEVPVREERIWTVSELNRTVRELLESEFPPLWVGGEVANFTRARSGHLYFTLKDEQAQLRCVMWRADAARLPMDPEEGMRIRAFGSLGLYEARGEFQLSVRRLEAEGEEGLWKIAFERLRKQLESEGLTDPSRRRPLPRFPRAVGIVTSPTGAALHDIVTVLRRRAPWTRVVLRGARVQGEGASVEIARAVRTLAGSGLVDVLIVGRGGGSIEDLWAFNEEPVARAIVASPVPVVSAVGHEVDVTIADLVADLRAPTPSAAAESVVPDGETIRGGLEAVRGRLSRALRRQTERRRHRLDAAGIRLSRAARGILQPHRHRLERIAGGLEGAIRREIQLHRERLARAAGQVDALSPLSTLRRGYAVPLAPDGRLLRRCSEFRPGSAFELRVVDGRVRCDVQGVEEVGS